MKISQKVFSLFFLETRDRIIQIITQAVAQITLQIRQTDSRIDLLEKELKDLKIYCDTLQKYIIKEK